MIEPGVILMKAVRVQAFTQRPDDIGIDEVPLPEPAHGQIRVRMLMCPVHPSDFHFVRGIYYQALERVIWNQGRTAADPRVCFDPGRSNECPVPPYTLGAEGVGIVDASGGGLLAKHLVGKRVAVGGVVHQTGFGRSSRSSTRGAPWPYPTAFRMSRPRCTSPIRSLPM